MYGERTGVTGQRSDVFSLLAPVVTCPADSFAASSRYMFMLRTGSNSLSSACMSASVCRRCVSVLSTQHVKDEAYLTVERIEQRYFTTQELLAAQEAFAISTRIGVVGISHFDDQQIGTHEYQGQAGAVSLALNELLAFERQPKPGSPLFTEVPYGYLTGMKSQLV